MKKYYIIVRIDNNGFNQEDFLLLKKWYNRGWYRKMLQYLQNWDYGEENIGTAMYNDDIWDTPCDPQAPSDKIIYQNLCGDQFLCHSEDLVYEAFYLVGVTTIEDFVFAY